MDRPALPFTVVLCVSLSLSACSSSNAGQQVVPRAATLPSTASTTSAAPASAATAPPPAPTLALRPIPAEDVLPAGFCHLDVYLDEECKKSAPRYALFLGVAVDAHAAEAALRSGGTGELATGYPFVTTLDDLPLADPKRKGLAVVAGLFERKDQAEQYQARLSGPTELVELASPEDAASRKIQPKDSRSSAVELAEDTAAFSKEDLEKTEEALDEALAQKWVSLPEQRERRERAIAALESRCKLPRGRVFSASHKDLIRPFMLRYAPVRCDDGAEAWVPWRATRLKSTVVRTGEGALVHQVMLVECDSPIIETRRFGADSVAKPLRLALRGGC
ncbi:hypothetical protein [Polyangium jinanense]|uniref:Lipoprotein n=1 Tax=Polyangium jinanense TaxID=2829994 RepID=A0A9X3X5P5_9BACT|nr:hypothetical protein [Polyangium jinanense]MDC3956669.1 hypothetical protein [Polyangium jinanense]MDC3984732.1 hypothetical protein [Polyangium jinanense]